MASSSALCSDGGPAALGDTAPQPHRCAGRSRDEGTCVVAWEAEPPWEASSVAVILLSGCCACGTP